MNAGLDKILKAISENPSNEVLRDRYLSLVTELPDGLEKADSVLKLASCMKETEPDYALKLCYFVHQYDRNSRDALELIVELFKLLSRPGKAEIIQNHLDTMGPQKDSTFQPRVSQQKQEFPADLPAQMTGAFDAEGSIVASIEGFQKSLKAKADDFSEEYSSYGRFEVNEVSKLNEAPAPKKTNIPLFTASQRKAKKKPAAPPPAPTFVLDEPVAAVIPENPTIMPPPIPEKVTEDVPSFSLESSTPKLSRHKEVDPDLAKKKASKKHAESNLIDNPEEVAGFIFGNDEGEKPINAHKVDLHQIREPEVAESNPPLVNSVSVEEHPEKPLESENHRSGPKIPLELFDYYWQQGFFEKASQILEKSKVFAKEETWWKIRYELLQSQRFNDAAKSQDFENLDPDLLQWQNHLKKLEKEGKSRRCMFEIYQRLKQTNDINCVKIGYNQLQSIWKKLGLQGFSWQPDTGIDQLREQLQKRSMPTLSVIVCGERF